MTNPPQSGQPPANLPSPPSYRKVMLHWATSAKRDATREARFAQLMAACAAGVRIELWAKRPSSTKA